MIQKLFLLRGLPGSGKTTLATDLAGGKPIVFAADDYFYENGPNPGVYDFDVTKLHAAHKQCFERTKAALEQGVQLVFVTNTFTTEKELKPYLELGKELGVQVISLVVENRHGNQSVHGVPRETIGKMVDRFSLKLV